MQEFGGVGARFGSPAGVILFADFGAARAVLGFFGEKGYNTGL